MENFLPVEDAAKQSTYSAGHIRYLIRHNLVQGKKISVLWLVDVDSLKEYESKMTAAGTAKFRPKSLDQEE
jgi:hypothetical protein